MSEFKAIKSKYEWDIHQSHQLETSKLQSLKFDEDLKEKFEEGVKLTIFPLYR
jgi:hypothetical protein